MTKEETGGIGYGIAVVLIFIYGLKTNRGWKYWLFSMLFIASAGYAIGSAFGKEQPPPSKDEPTETI